MKRSFKTEMNTISYNIPILKPRKHGEYVIILEDLEFRFRRVLIIIFFLGKVCLFIFSDILD